MGPINPMQLQTRPPMGGLMRPPMGSPMSSSQSEPPLSGPKIDMRLRKEFGDVLSQLRREVSLERTAQVNELQINNRLWKGDYATVPQIINGQMSLVSMLGGSLTNGGTGSGIPQHRFNFYRVMGLS